MNIFSIKSGEMNFHCGLLFYNNKDNENRRMKDSFFLIGS
jgi:hypothetical protein